MKLYKVGGAVRDSLMGVRPSDTDWVVIGSSPEEMISKGYKPIGKDFPVFLHPKTNEEYALARTEKKTGTGYGGFTFYYGADVSLEEDLSRRDFTINAIAQDNNGNIIDPFNGQKDIENKLFKHVSQAFYEDPLRAIRLARFYSYKHLTKFNIDGSTIKGIEKIVTSGEIANLSSNRIWSETERALSSDHPSSFFEKIITLNLCDPFFNELNQPIKEFVENGSARNDELSSRFSGLIRTRTFGVNGDSLWYRYKGKADVFMAVNSHRQVAGPLHGVVRQKLDSKGNEWKWHRHQVKDYIGFRVHVEFTPRGDFSLERVQFGDGEPPVIHSVNSRVADFLKSDEDLASLFISTAADHAAGNSNHETAQLLNWVIRNGNLLEKPLNLALAANKFAVYKKKKLTYVKSNCLR